MSPPMARTRLHRKLDPGRFPNMSVKLAAVLGFVLEREHTTRSLADIKVTPDGHVLAWASGAKVSAIASTSDRQQVCASTCAAWA